MVQQEGTKVEYPIVEEETSMSSQIRPRRPRKLLFFPHCCEKDLCTDPYNFGGPAISIEKVILYPWDSVASCYGVCLL
jgi:hypothetical protein